jgi:hypothetical protein
MDNQRSRLLFALLFLLASVSASAASEPKIRGTIHGQEFCWQDACGYALFAGTFAGRVDNKRTGGTIVVQVTHDSVPTYGSPPAMITGGSWVIRTLAGDFKGTIAGGTLTANNDNTFDVTATLTLVEGGSGTLSFKGELDHNNFPPTITGTVLQ